MKEYKVISHFSPLEFSKLVEDELSKGWQLVGGVSATNVANLTKPGVYQMILFQAVGK